MATYFCLLLVCYGVITAAGSISEDQSGGAGANGAELEQHLSFLNKPAVKSIESPDGDIIDCVLIEHQPAFDHPALKGSTIKRSPELRPQTYNTESSLEHSSCQLWQQNGKCPSGTIPIRRTSFHDILRVGSAKEYGRKSHRSAHHRKKKSIPPGAMGIPSHEHAIAYVEGGGYYGARANINVWNPQVHGSNEFSLAQVWILGGSFDGSIGNSIEAGWQACTGTNIRGCSSTGRAIHTKLRAATTCCAQDLSKRATR